MSDEQKMVSVSQYLAAECADLLNIHDSGGGSREQFAVEGLREAIAKAEHHHSGGVTDMVSVPRELAVSLADDWGSPLATSRSRMRVLLDSPAEQHQGEPVYQVSDGVSGWEDVDLLRYTACSLRPEEYEVRMLYIRPSPADSGEVERLRAESVDTLGELEDLVEKLNNALSKLAGREALLRIYESFPGYLLDNCEGETVYEEHLQQWLAAHIKNLSASAEPSAPVERDERAECAICKDLGDQCLECEEAEFREWADRHFASADYRKTAAGVFIQDWMRHAFAAWQARASLERKPEALVDQLQADLTQRDERVDDLATRLAAQTELLKRLYDPLMEAAMEYDDKFEPLAEEVAELIKIEDAAAQESAEPDHAPTITIPPGLGNYDGSDNGVD